MGRGGTSTRLDSARWTGEENKLRPDPSRSVSFPTLRNVRPPSIDNTDPSFALTWNDESFRKTRTIQNASIATAGREKGTVLDPNVVDALGIGMGEAGIRRHNNGRGCILRGNHQSKDRRRNSCGTTRQVSVDGAVGMRPARTASATQPLLRGHAPHPSARAQRRPLQPQARGMRSKRRHRGLQVRIRGAIKRHKPCPTDNGYYKRPGLTKPCACTPSNPHLRTKTSTTAPTKGPKTHKGSCASGWNKPSNIHPTTPPRSATMP